MNIIHSFYLEIILGVPIRIVDDHCVRGGQIDAQPAGPRGQQKAEVGGARRVEVVQCLLPQIRPRRPIQPLMRNLSTL